MRRLFLLVAVPLAVLLAVPLVLLGRAVPHMEHVRPWGLTADRRAALVDVGVRLGLKRGTVSIVTAAAPAVGGDPFLLQGRDRSGRRCVYVVHGRSHSALRCLPGTLRHRPIMLVGFDFKPPAPGSRGREFVGLVRKDVGSVVMVAPVSSTPTGPPKLQGMNVALTSSRGLTGFNVGVMSAPAELQAYDVHGRLITTVHVADGS